MERKKETMTTHSNGGNTWLTKLERIARVSKEKPKERLNNIGHVIDFDFLLDCFKSLDGKKAVGVDGITKDVYAMDLTANLTELLVRIRRGTYRPQAARLVLIPKEDGSTRPLAISSIEDKIVQLASSRILESIYEVQFLDCSYGYRPGRNAHDALETLTRKAIQVKWGLIYEIDLKKYFNSIPHDKLMRILEMKISDSRFLGLISTQLKMPIVTEKGVEPAQCGVPQGANLSPILSNVFLHYALDRWFEHQSKSSSRIFLGQADLVRFCDDCVFVFEKRDDGEKFVHILKERLARFGIELNEEKSSLQHAGRRKMKEMFEQGKRLPSFKFLGFQIYWKRNRNGFFRLGFKPRSDRFRTKLKSIKEHLKKHRNVRNHVALLRDVKRVVEGWVRYFSITDCEPMVHAFITEVRRLIHRWFNQRGGRQSIPWKRVHPILISINFPRTSCKTRSMYPGPRVNQTKSRFSGA